MRSSKNKIERVTRFFFFGVGVGCDDGDSAAQFMCTGMITKFGMGSRREWEMSRDELKQYTEIK